MKIKWVAMTRFAAVLIAVFAGAVDVLWGQTPSSAGGSPTLQDSKEAGDPLAVGKAAMQHADYLGAKTFFEHYLKATENDWEAWLYLGSAELNLNQPAEAGKAFQRAIELKPDAWAAHASLTLAYAEMQNWSAFDKERALMKIARDAKKPGINLEGHDVIDVLHINGKEYQVWYFYKLHGTYNTRYVFLHFDEKGHADNYVQCESDDVDQGFFKDKHPKQAAAGDRSFSLDSYDVTKDGMKQALIKFYMDGEPTYETVRADALKVLAGESKPAASMTAPAKKPS